ncbi:MAG: hypothetical protein VYC34_03450 [Planctomycetota bacterium]|nr:hypothetical protein [Planctomycetota bacterium]
MPQALERKERLHKIIDLARVSKGWSRAQLARSLGRDATKLYPESGNPKLDFLVRLAGVLEWPVGDVVEAIWGGRVTRSLDAEDDDGNITYESLDAEALKAHREGRWADMVDVAHRQFAAARTPAERALACNREFGGWDGLGRYQNARDAAQRGLQYGPLPTVLRLQLQGNLANAYYALWDLTPALGISQVLIEWHDANPPEKKADGKRRAFAHYVRGNTFRRMMQAEPENTDRLAPLAKADLELSRQMYLDLAEALDDESLLGIANTCAAGILEVDAALGAVSGEEAIEQVMTALEQVIDLDANASGDLLESYGWWCVFGSNIALRHLEGPALQQAMAIFTNKALEIADRLDNWSMRERVFSMQFRLHEVMTDTTGFRFDYTIDDEDRRLIAGAMGRFPRFRHTGWRILETAKVVASA